MWGGDMRSVATTLALVWWMAVIPASAWGTGGHRRHGQGPVRSSASWRERGGGEPGADREGLRRGYRRNRSVPRRGPASRHLHRDVHVARIQHPEARRGRADRQTVADVCDVRAGLPELSVSIGAGLMTSSVSPTSPYCHVD